MAHVSSICIPASVAAAVRQFFPGWHVVATAPLLASGLEPRHHVQKLTLQYGQGSLTLVLKQALTEDGPAPAISELRCEICLARSWSAAGLPIPQWVDGSEEEGWMLTRCVDGETAWSLLDPDSRLSGTSSHQERATILRRIGETVARFHTLEPALDDETTCELPTKTVDTLLSELARNFASIERRLSAADRALFSEQLRRLDANRPDNRESVICHGDLSGHNIICGSNYAVHLLDWSHACFGPPAWDVAFLMSFAGGLCVTQDDQSVLLAGYRTVSKKELADLDYFISFDRLNQKVNAASNNHGRRTDISQGAVDT